MQDILTDQQARINLYALLSRLLMSEADKTLLETIESDENMMSFFPNYAKWDRRRELDHKDLLEQYLNVDFTNLFLLHMTPYESFYLREDQQMETGGDNPVLQLFNEYDFHIDLGKARAVSADHIGIELEFMYMLCDAQMKALKDENFVIACELAVIERDFLRDHLLEWGPMFLLNMKSEAGTALYFDTADLCLEFMLSDYDYLDTLISDDKCEYQV